MCSPPKIENRAIHHTIMGLLLLQHQLPAKIKLALNLQQTAISKVNLVNLITEKTSSSCTPMTKLSIRHLQVFQKRTLPMILFAKHRCTQQHFVAVVCGIARIQCIESSVSSTHLCSHPPCTTTFPQHAIKASVEGHTEKN